MEPCVFCKAYDEDRCAIHCFLAKEMQEQKYEQRIKEEEQILLDALSPQCNFCSTSCVMNCRLC